MIDSSSELRDGKVKNDLVTKLVIGSSLIREFDIYRIYYFYP